MKWLVRFYVKEIYHTEIEAPSRKEAESQLHKNVATHTEPYNHFDSETAVIGISPAEGEVEPE